MVFAVPKPVSLGRRSVRCGERERTLRFDTLRFLCVRLSRNTVYGLVRREIVRYGLSMRFSASM